MSHVPFLLTILFKLLFLNAYDKYEWGEFCLGPKLPSANCNIGVVKFQNLVIGIALFGHAVCSPLAHT